MKALTLKIASILLLVGMWTNTAYCQATGWNPSDTGVSSPLLLLNACNG
jgi:hypothetical protein